MRKKLIILWFIVPIVAFIYIVLYVTNVYAADHVSLNTINDLKTSNLSLGTVVKTKGYNTIGDNGEAQYMITAKPNYPVDDIFVIAIQDGKFAQMVISPTSVINVACAGIFPNDTISEKLNKLINSANGKVSGIQFNSGTYYINSNISLRSLAYIGNGQTTLSVSPDYSTQSYGIFTNAAGQEYLGFESLKFEYNMTPSHLLANKASVLLALSDINLCTINNCSFSAKNSASNTTSITLLWFRHSSKIQNVSITNSTFNNLMGDSVTADTIIRGGSIWFNGPPDTYNSNFSGILIKNCNITHTTTDEAIAFWFGKFKNISIKDNIINSKNHTANNIISFHHGSFEANINNVSINTTSRAKTIILLDLIQGESDISVDSCHMNFCAQKSDPYKNTHNIVLVYRDPYNTQVAFNNNTLDSLNGTVYRSLVDCEVASNTHIEINSNIISSPLLYGLVDICNSNNISASIIDNQLSGSSYFASATECKSCSIEANNNTVTNGHSLFIRGNAGLNYTANNNRFKQLNSDPLVYFKESAKTNSNVNLKESNNTSN